MMLSQSVGSPSKCKLLLTALLAAALTACGGSSGGENAAAITSLQAQDTTTTDQTTTDTGTGSSVLKMGSGVGDEFVEGVVGVLSTSVKSGVVVPLTVNFVDGDNAGVATDYSVDFSSTCLSQGLATITPETATTSNGLVQAEYTALGCTGTDTVTARSTVENALLTSTIDLAIESDAVLAVEAVSVSEPQISLAGIGGQETSTVTFKLTGSQSAPIIGESVSFEVSSTAGGAQIASGQETGLTNSSGEVSTVVQSGTVPTSLTVKATHNATGINGTSQSVTISTGIPVQGGFSLAMTASVEGALTNNGIENQIAVFARDSLGNPVPDGTQVSFISPYSGIVDPSCELVDGACTVSWRSARPKDSQYVGILAYMSGAEEFVDINGNNVYDSSDEFDQASYEDGFNNRGDVSEPYIDLNDNDTFDTGDEFHDSDGDFAWDSPNGVWDGPCLSALDGSAICSGNDAVDVWNSFVFVMPQDSLEYYEATDYAVVSIPNTVGTGGVVNLGLTDVADIVSDPHVPGVAPPTKTTINFALKNAPAEAVVVTQSLEVDNTIKPYVFSVSISNVGGASMASGATLEVTATTPAGRKAVAVIPLVFL